MIILEKLQRYWKLIALIGGLIAVVLIAGWIFDSCSRWMERRDIERDKENINRELQNANQIKDNLNALGINEALKEQEVNRNRGDYANAVNATDNAREITNNAIFNANAIRNANYENKRLEDALKAKCAAYPKSSGCPQ